MSIEGHDRVGLAVHLNSPNLLLDAREFPDVRRE